jgi:hypothetical protein
MESGLDELLDLFVAFEMRADGCALAYETFAVVFLVVIPEGDLLFRYSMDEWTSTERLTVLNSADALRRTISRLCPTVDRRRVRDKDLLDRIELGNLSI